MTDYIKHWIDVIENMNNENTYKLAWGRAILELVVEKNTPGEMLIHFEQIAHKMLKYYWNQIFFFNLKQSPQKKPIIVQETEKCIELVNSKRDNNAPIWFDKAEHILQKEDVFYQKEIRKIATTLGYDVSWRFLKANNQEYNLYLLDKKAKTVYLSQHDVSDLKEYAFVLSQLLNYRWAQLLEKFNNSPRIALKVKGISDEKIRRHSLKKYKDILISQMENGQVKDFYTGYVLNVDDISVDHVIPWSYMYSDDLWNLVLTSKSMNSSKSNSIPSEAVIHRLEDRNLKLIETFDKRSQNYLDLKIAIEQNYVQKFYLAYKL